MDCRYGRVVDSAPVSHVSSVSTTNREGEMIAYFIQSRDCGIAGLRMSPLLTIISVLDSLLYSRQPQELPAGEVCLEYLKGNGNVPV